ncbi:MAG: helix-turn-helix transcriptional regulator [Rhodobacteraceae bacterium]|nr:helix-turn-helix transcriptional regulator [Paracoccaceae bacterium]
MTGEELKAHRKKAGLSQRELAEAAGVHRCTVVYWEGKPDVDLRGHAPTRFFEALKLKVYWTPNAHTRSWGFRDQPQEYLDVKLAGELKRLTDNTTIRSARERVRCGAKTRKGAPCRLLSEAGRRRCKFHGGMSTGPRTIEGRERIATAQRKRWTLRRLQNQH